jgi:hypothetical protein
VGGVTGGGRQQSQVPLTGHLHSVWFKGSLVPTEAFFYVQLHDHDHTFVVAFVTLAHEQLACLAAGHVGGLTTGGGRQQSHDPLTGHLHSV